MQLLWLHFNLNHHINEIHKLMWAWGKIKVDPTEDHSKLMANLGLSIGHVYLLLKTEPVVLDKSTKRKLEKDGLLINNIVDLK